MTSSSVSSPSPSIWDQITLELNQVNSSSLSREKIRHDAEIAINELGVSEEEALDQVKEHVREWVQDHPPTHDHKNKDQTKHRHMIRSLPCSNLNPVIQSFDRNGNMVSESRLRHRKMTKILVPKETPSPTPLPSSSPSPIQPEIQSEIESVSTESVPVIPTAPPMIEEHTLTVEEENKLLSTTSPSPIQIPPISDPSSGSLPGNHVPSPQQKRKGKSAKKNPPRQQKSPVKPLSSSIKKKKFPIDEVDDPPHPDIVILRVNPKGNYQAYLFGNYLPMEEEFSAQNIYEWSKGPILRKPVYKLSLDQDYWMDSSSRDLLRQFNTFLLRSIGTQSIGGYDDLEPEPHEIFHLDPIHRALFDHRKRIHTSSLPPFIPAISDDLNKWFFGSTIPRTLHRGSTSVYFGGVKNGKPDGNGIECTPYGYKMGVWKQGDMVSGEIKLVEK